MKESTLHNPIYFFSKDHMKKDFQYCSDYMLRRFSDEAPFKPVFPDKAVKRHLRVDATYHEALLFDSCKRRHAHLSPAHYTERYFNKDQTEHATFHVYFDTHHSFLLVKGPGAKRFSDLLNKNSFIAKQFLIQMQFKLDQVVNSIDFNKIKILERSVELGIKSKDIGILSETLPMLVELLSRYDTYTFGEPTANTQRYQSILDRILLGHDVAAEERAVDEALVLTKAPEPDHALSSAKESRPLSITLLERATGWLAELRSLSQKEIRPEIFKEYTRTISDATIFWLTFKPESKKEIVTFNLIKGLIDQMPAPDTLFNKAMFAGDICMLNALMDFYERQTPVMIYKALDRLRESAISSDKALDDPLSKSLACLFSQLPDDPRYKIIFNDLAFVMKDIRLTCKEFLVCIGFQKTFLALHTHFPLLGNFAKNSEYTILDHLCVLEAGDTSANCKLQMALMYAKSSAPVKLSGKEQRLFYQGGQVLDLVPLMDKKYEENLLELFFDAIYQDKRDRERLPVKTINQLAIAYSEKVGADVVLNQLAGLDSRYGLQGKNLLKPQVQVPSKDRILQRRIQEIRDYFLSFLRAAQTQNDELVKQKFPWISEFPDNGIVQLKP
ncbi:hypothetical protein N9C31_01085 [Gammaproteobacteria bacterium]|nr:hypothetical protein [Gammaproteobacteria bacterium]